MVKIYEGTSPGTKKEDSPDLFASQFIIMHMSDHLFSETVFPCLATGAANHLFVSRQETMRCTSWSLVPANLATPGNTTRNNVSATMFPSLTRPFNNNKRSHENRLENALRASYQILRSS